MRKHLNLNQWPKEALYLIYMTVYQCLIFMWSTTTCPCRRARGAWEALGPIQVDAYGDRGERTGRKRTTYITMHLTGFPIYAYNMVNPKIIFPGPGYSEYSHLRTKTPPPSKPKFLNSRFHCNGDGVGKERSKKKFEKKVYYFIIYYLLFLFLFIYSIFIYFIIYNIF